MVTYAFTIADSWLTNPILNAVLLSAGAASLGRPTFSTSSGSVSAPTIINARTMSSQNTLFNISSGGTTESNNLNVFGSSAYNGATVNVYLDGTLQGTATTAADGSWHYNLPILSDAAHSVYATLTYGGSTSGASSTYSFTVAPGITSVSNTHSGGNTVGSNLYYQATFNWSTLSMRTESDNGFANPNCCIFASTHELDFTLTPTDSTPAQGSGQRTEILETGTRADGTTFNVTYEFLLSGSSPINDCWSGGPFGGDSWSVIGQYHDSGSGPPVHENLLGSSNGGDTYNVWYDTATAIAYAGPSNLTRGVWHTFDAILKPNSSGAVFQVWLDGVQIVNLTTLHGTSPYYWKMGYYRGPAPPTPDQTQTIRYRNFLATQT